MWHGWGRVVVETSRRVSEDDEDASFMEKSRRSSSSVGGWWYSWSATPPVVISPTRTSERRAVLLVAAEADLDKQSSPSIRATSSVRHVRRRSPRRREPIRPPSFVLPGDSQWPALRPQHDDIVAGVAQDHPHRRRLPRGHEESPHDAHQRQQPGPLH